MKRPFTTVYTGLQETKRQTSINSYAYFFETGATECDDATSLRGGGVLASRNFISMLGARTLVGFISHPPSLLHHPYQIQLANCHQCDVVPDEVLSHSVPSGLFYDQSRRADVGELHHVGVWTLLSTLPT